MHRYSALCFALAVWLCSCGGSPPAPAPSSEGPATASGGGRHRHRHRGARAIPNNGAPETGKFDFYVLSLSWSPGFCATAAGRNDPAQCGGDRHFAFVLHGLWPQYDRGGWPQSCTNEPMDQSLIEPMLAIMPSPVLVEHEWEKHGTCSGLSPKDYFDDAAEAFKSIAIPSPYLSPQREIVVSPQRLHDDFAAANPKIGDAGFVVLCSGNGRYLQEVRACLSPDLEGRACNDEALRAACKSDDVIMRPLR